MEYVAYAYVHEDIEGNVKLVQKYLNDNWLQSGICFSPVTMFHEQHTTNILESSKKDPTWWARVCRKFLSQSSSMTVIVGSFSAADVTTIDKVVLSHGVLVEIAVATMLNIPIRYTFFNESSSRWQDLPSFVVRDLTLSYIQKDNIK